MYIAPSSGRKGESVTLITDRVLLMLIKLGLDNALHVTNGETTNINIRKLKYL